MSWNSIVSRGLAYKARKKERKKERNLKTSIYTQEPCCFPFKVHMSYMCMCALMCENTEAQTQIFNNCYKAPLSSSTWELKSNHEKRETPGCGNFMQTIGSGSSQYTARWWTCPLGGVCSRVMATTTRALFHLRNSPTKWSSLERVVCVCICVLVRVCVCACMLSVESRCPQLSRGKRRFSAR